MSSVGRRRVDPSSIARGEVDVTIQVQKWYDGPFLAHVFGSHGTRPWRDGVARILRHGTYYGRSRGRGGQKHNKRSESGRCDKRTGDCIRGQKEERDGERKGRGNAPTEEGQGARLGLKEQKEKTLAEAREPMRQEEEEREGSLLRKTMMKQQRRRREGGELRRREEEKRADRQIQELERVETQLAHCAKGGRLTCNIKK